MAMFGNEKRQSAVFIMDPMPKIKLIVRGNIDSAANRARLIFMMWLLRTNPAEDPLQTFLKLWSKRLQSKAETISQRPFIIWA